MSDQVFPGVRTASAGLLLLALMLLLAPGASARGTMAVQPDGKVVLGGHAYLGFGAVVRYQPDGSLDRGFGERGVVVDHRIGAFSVLALQSGGRILTAAPRLGSGGPMLARYLSGGSPDRGFGYRGLATSPIPEAVGTQPTAIVQRPDGYVVVAVNHCCSKSFDSPPASLELFGPAGSFDGTFPGLNGEPPIGPFRLGQITDLVGLGDGSVVAIGAGSEAGDLRSAPWGAAMLKFRPDRGYDSSFRNGRGPLLGAEASAASAAGLDARGGILVAGAQDHALTLARYGADGLLDTSFGEGGVAGQSGRSRLAVPDAISLGGLAVQPDGRIVVLGTGSGQATIVRFEADGRLDTSFGDGGLARLGEGSGTDHPVRGKDVAVLADGRILVSGTAGGETQPFVLARYTGAGRLDPTFGEEGVATTAICPGTERQRRRAGCLPAARIRLSVSNLRGPKPVLRLRVRPNVPWARIDGVRLQLPRALRLEAPNAGHMSGITVGLGGRHGNPGVHPHSLNVNHLGFARSLSATLWGGALRSVGEIPPGRKLTFRVSVRFADIGRPEGEQTVVLRRR